MVGHYIYYGSHQFETGVRDGPNTPISSFKQGALKLVSVVSRILDTMRMVRHYGLKTTHQLRHNLLDTIY